MSLKHFLKDHAYQNIPLTFEEAYALGEYLIKGCNGDAEAQIQSIVILSALHTLATYNWKWSKGVEVRHGHRLPKNSAEQIAGICTAIFEHDIAKSKSGFLNPAVSYAMDNCGMGGDLIVTANVSTLSALIASVAKIPMCKHGSPANADQGRHGSSDFVSSLGINTCATKEEVENCVEKEYFGYTEALDTNYKKIHLQTHQFAKLPHMNDIIGTITNPLSPKIMTRRVLGVNHLVSPSIVAEAYRILNKRGTTNLNHGLFIRGFADQTKYKGMDEVSICSGGTQVAELKDDQIYERHLYASDFNLENVDPKSISPSVGMSKGEFSNLILHKKITGAPVKMVLANAALLFYLAGYSEDLKKCYTYAEEVYESGKVYNKVISIRKLL